MATGFWRLECEHLVRVQGVGSFDFKYYAATASFPSRLPLNSLLYYGPRYGSIAVHLLVRIVRCIVLLYGMQTLQSHRLLIFRKAGQLPPMLTRYVLTLPPLLRCNSLSSASRFQRSNDSLRDRT